LVHSFVTAATIGFLIAAALMVATPAYATHPVVRQPRNLHWQNSHTLWHWGSNLDTNHPAYKNPSDNGRQTWTQACCPDGQWHGHFNSSSASHVNVQDCSNPDWIACYSLTYNGNVNLHLTQATIWFDSQRVSNNKFYTGTGSPPSDKYDAWSAAAEEWGHAQNIDHFGSSCNTMSGTTLLGTTCKRNTNQTERQSAQEAYDGVHPGTFFDALNEIPYE
jgi:hypothetical protein